MNRLAELLELLEKDFCEFLRVVFETNTISVVVRRTQVRYRPISNAVHVYCSASDERTSIEGFFSSWKHSNSALSNGHFRHAIMQDFEGLNPLLSKKEQGSKCETEQSAWRDRRRPAEGSRQESCAAVRETA